MNDVRGDLRILSLWSCAIHCYRHDTLSEREERVPCTFD